MTSKLIVLFAVIGLSWNVHAEQILSPSLLENYNAVTEDNFTSFISSSKGVIKVCAVGEASNSFVQRNFRKIIVLRNSPVLSNFKELKISDPIFAKISPMKDFLKKTH